MSQDYIYAVARIRAKELGLLTRQDLEQLLSLRTAEDCVRALRDKGWGRGDETSPEALLAAEEEKTWELMAELVPDLSPFDVLILPDDYNNLKAAIKCAVTDVEPHDVFLPGGKLDPALLLRCARESDFSPLPPAMAEAAGKAHRALLQTGDGQRCDVILDRACLEEIQRQGKASGHPLLRDYAELVCATADIQMAARACKTKKNRDFLEEALVPCETLEKDRLIQAALASLEDIAGALRGTPYEDAGAALKESASAFEKWRDERTLDLIRDQKSNPFTIGPLFAYVLARRGEIASARIILSGKANELDGDMIRQRVRDTYV